MKSLSDNALTKCTLWFSMTVCISAEEFPIHCKIWFVIRFICPRWIYDWKQNKPWANLKQNCHFTSDSWSWNRAVPDTILGFITYMRNIWQLLSRTHHMSAARPWKWKWSNDVEKSEIDLFWCLSMTNNVKSCKKSMEESKLSDLVFLQWDVRSSVLKTPKNTKTRETKMQITQFFEKVWPI